jgi:hypothetical protein
LTIAAKTTKLIEMNSEIFSFHLIKQPLLKIPQLLFSPGQHEGLKHGECFFTMKLGDSITSFNRYNLKSIAYFAWWNDEGSLDRFLSEPSQKSFADGWHVRMKLYRRWGQVNEIKNAAIIPDLTPKDSPVVAVTLARLKLLETKRFTQWGKPVERQVREHKGQKLALAAFRPLNTFCTFSIWKNENEMLKMVSGRDPAIDGEDHRLAMQERIRKDFHHEFTTMRFAPFKEVGAWEGKSNYACVTSPKF